MKAAKIVLIIILIIATLAAAALVLARGSFVIGELQECLGTSPAPIPTPTAAPTASRSAFL